MGSVRRRAIPLEHEEGVGWQQLAVSGLPCDGRAVAAWAKTWKWRAAIPRTRRTKILRRMNILTTSVTILKFKDGRVGKVASVIDCLQPYYFHVHLVGSEGSSLDNKIYSTHLGALDKSRWSDLAMKLLDSGDVSDHPYQMQFQAFFDALDKGMEMPLTSLAHAAQPRDHFRGRRLAERHAHRKH